MFNSKIGMINYELGELREGINWGLRGFDHALGYLGLEWKYRAAWNGPAWLDDPNWSLPALALMSLWSVGNSVVIYLAGLQDVPAELYEAAEIDGAGLWNRMWNVTLPMISPVIFFNLVMSIIGVLQVFDIPYIMTPNGGPGNRSTLLLAVYLQDVSFRFFKMGYASAIAWIMLLVIVILTGIAFWTSKRWVHYQGK
jgi:multiple sugar transport system permease protein